MAQEEQQHVLSSSYSGGGAAGGSIAVAGGSVNKSKTVKQKKVPQRGLGVAQLEKIRLEEQRKREALQAANVLANNAIGSVLGNEATQVLAIQCPNYYRSAPSIPVPMAKQLNDDAGEVRFPEILGPGNEEWHRLWKGGRYNVDVEDQRVVDVGLGFRTREELQPSPVLLLPGVPQIPYQFQMTSSCSSVVNASPLISPAHVLSPQMEPPSNQSLCGSNYQMPWPEGDKMVGIKRSYPFSLESPPASSLLCNFHTTNAAVKPKSDEIPSCSSGFTAQTEPRYKFYRDCPSNSSPVQEQSPSDTKRDHEGTLNGDFLTLALPTAASPPLDSKSKCKVNAGPQSMHSQESRTSQSGSTDPTFSFFPTRPQINQSRKGEKGEAIDLNLKL